MKKSLIYFCSSVRLFSTICFRENIWFFEMQDGKYHKIKLTDLLETVRNAHGIRLLVCLSTDSLFSLAVPRLRRGAYQVVRHPQ